METLPTATWSPDADRYCLLGDASAGRSFTAEPFGDGDGLAVVLVELDDDERDTGRVAGVEIIGFLAFNRWQDVPSIPNLWKLPEEMPLSLEELLRLEQARVRGRTAAPG